MRLLRHQVEKMEGIQKVLTKKSAVCNLTVSAEECDAKNGCKWDGYGYAYPPLRLPTRLGREAAALVANRVCSH